MPLNAGSLTKLLLRLRKLQGQVPYKLTAEAMLFLAAILRLGESAQMAHPIDADSQDRMITCLEVLPHLHRCSSRSIPTPLSNAYLVLHFSLASCCLWRLSCGWASLCIWHTPSTLSLRIGFGDLARGAV